MFDYERFGRPHGWLHAVRPHRIGAPTMLVLHGASGNWTNYRPLIRYFRHTHAIHSLDLRGHGRSGWPGDSTLDDFFQDVEAYAATLPRPFELVAHSFGGYLGVRLAAEHPDWVSRLTLLNTGWSIPQGLPYRLMRWLTPYAGLLARPEGIISTGSAITAYLMDHILPDWDCRPYYPRVMCPTMTVLGGLDPMIPLSVGRESAALLGSRLHVLPVGFHVSMWEQPGRIAGWMRRFSADHPA